MRWFLLVLAACQQAHTVTLQLGPSDDTLTQGFTCVQDADPTKLLAQRGFDPSTGELRFQIVVDVISLGGALPGCRGEELFAACKDMGTCAIVPRPDDRRFCVEIVVDAASVTAALNKNLAPMLASIRQQLQSGGAVTLDAPNEPVIIRAVATTETCNQIDSFAFDALVGCAYSCPVQLDDVDGTIALSLDTLSNMCEKDVRACSVFPP